MKKKLTKVMKQEITKQWNEQFPEMAIYKNMWIANIIGPIVVGILLDVKSGNDSYYPTLHLDNLADEIDDELSLIAPIRVPFESVSTISPKGKYVSIANQLENMTVIPLKGDWDISVLLDRMKAYCMKSYYEVDLLNMLEMLMYLTGWADIEEARIDICDFVKKRSLYLLKKDYFVDEEDRVQWYNDLLEKTSKCDVLRGKVDSNIEALQLSHLPRRVILGARL